MKRSRHWPMMVSLLAWACGGTVAVEDLSPIPTKGFDGAVPNKVEAFNTELRQCSDKRKQATTVYNSVRKADNHWTFWTVTLGLLAEAAAVVIAAVDDDSGDAPAIIAGASGAAIALSFGVQSASGIKGNANASYDVYAYWNARINTAREDFQRLENDLKTNDVDAVSKLDGLIARVRYECSQSFTPMP